MTSSPKRDGSLNFRATSFSLRTGSLVAWMVTSLGYGMTGVAASAADMSVDKMLNATPLVLKDGRIAEVSVHTIPFPDDAAAPASTIRNQLDAFTQSIATDCFLTAQVIGHVDTSEISGRETADIHRLARARADEIQKSLIDNGLPATSIASVWDWRFMVKQPRVTLWVFRLTAGDDCEGAPLDETGGDQVASATTPDVSAGSASGAREEQAVAAASATRPAAIEQQVIPAVRPKDKGVTAPIPTVPSVVESTAKETPDVNSVLAEKHSNSGETRHASLSASEVPDEKGSIGLVEQGALEIVFATNSSYFPEGAGDQLRAFMKTLDKDKNYVLRIQTSVDGDASVSGVSSSDETERYNAWLAERRFKRVEAWLLKNADGRQLTLDPSLIENDGSRRVRIEPNPLG